MLLEIAYFDIGPYLGNVHEWGCFNFLFVIS